MRPLLVLALAAALAGIIVAPAQGAALVGAAVIEVRPGPPRFRPPADACPGGRLVLALRDHSGRRTGVLLSCVRRQQFECHRTDPSGSCLEFDRRVFTKLRFVLPRGKITIRARIDESGSVDYATGDSVLAQSYSGDVIRATGRFRGKDGTLTGGGTYTFHTDGTVTPDAVMVIALGRPGSTRPALSAVPTTHHSYETLGAAFTRLMPGVDRRE